MGIKVDILQGGTNSHGVTVEDFNAFGTDFLVDGIVGTYTNTAGVAPATGAFATNQKATPGMYVTVTAGTAYVTGTPTSGVSQRLRVVLDANEDVTIAANATGGTRYDWVYIKLDADKMKDPGVNADDVATLVTSRSTSSSTDNGTPPTYGYCIAVVTVLNGASSILNASISDKRNSVLKNLVNTEAIADDSITNAKLDTTAGEPGGAWKAWTTTLANVTIGTGGTAVGYYTQIGKTIHFIMTITLGTSGALTGAATFTLPVTASSHYTVSKTQFGLVRYDDGGTNTGLGTLDMSSTTVARFLVSKSDGTYVLSTVLANNVPHTWAATDVIYAVGTYEAA